VVRLYSFYVRNDHYKVLIKSTDVIIYDTS